MKEYLFISYGFEPPTAEIMEAWGKWFESIKGRIQEQRGLRSGRMFTSDGMQVLSPEKESATGYIVFTAKDQEEAESIAQGCPIVANNVIHEIMSRQETC